MAGIALFGDLTPLLEGTETIEIGHLIESVKVFPPEGKNENEHVGYITAQAVGRAEINRPDLKGSSVYHGPSSTKRRQKIFKLPKENQHHYPQKSINSHLVLMKKTGVLMMLGSVF